MRIRHAALLVALLVACDGSRTTDARRDPAGGGDDSHGEGGGGHPAGGEGGGAEGGGGGGGVAAGGSGAGGRIAAGGAGGSFDGWPDPSGLPPADETAAWEQVVSPAELPVPGVWSIGVSRFGELWMGTDEGLVYRSPEGAIRVLTTEDGLAVNLPVAVAARGRGEAFVGYGYAGNDLGWVRLEEDGASTITHHVIADLSMGEAIHDLFRILVDRRPGREDHVWLCTNEVVALFLGSDPVLQHRHPTHPHGSCWGLAIDAAGGVWEGDMHQIARLGYDETGNFFTAPWQHVTPLFPEAPRADVFDLSIDGNGDVWAASLGNGLARYSPSTGGVDVFLPPRIPSLALRAGQVAPDGTVWVGSQDHGVAALTREGTTFHNTRGKLGSNSIRDIEIEDDGTVWLATDRGVWRLRP